MGAADPIRSALSDQYVQTLLSIKARQLLRRPEFRRSEQADIEHDLIIHVLRQADNYEPSRSTPHTFITRVVETAAGMLVRDRSRIKRTAGYKAISLNGTPVGTSEGDATLGDLLDDDDLRRHHGGYRHDHQHSVDLAADLAQAMKDLTPRQREIAERLATASEAAVARTMGVSRRQVRKELAAIRQQLQFAQLAEP